ncbi:ABC transporter permease subunit [Halostagnicola sp. A-GB9-2]|uniref:ABC transporter permease subunit n=1 Tax=Halostagnicola sp. A-GB9-2 TaxID=3048066 RepID=UPI0024C0695E|nr:ABC transporter permease subunit [Halostagnicola sp. A-GB9-2]MDJ1434595.1 ABC transporter permease subunit [Halostagnicola sp. A-GB9-2]
MTAILRTESGKLLRSSVLLTGMFALLSAFMFAAFPGFAEEAEFVEEAFPPVLIGLFGFEALHTIEGFVASYLFSLIWVLFAGMFFAYVSAGLIVEDVRTRKMDLILSNPVSRESVVLQKVAALWVPLVVVNVGLLVVLLAGANVLGESLDPIDLGVALLLSVPYLLVCAGVGIVLSVTVDRVETAQASALGLVFVLWLVDGLSNMGPDFGWVGQFTPSRYVTPTDVLVHEEYAYGEAGILLAVFFVLLGLAVFIFTRRDI